MTNNHSLLAIFAHPDDESFLVAGTLAQYAALGYEVNLICATRGEAGEISDPALASPENLGQVREQELRQAAAVMGLNEVIFLDYRDSGMAGSEANQHPAAFINAPAVQVVSRLVREIRRLKPQVIITFESGGGYGHLDYLAIHHAAVAALQAAAGGSYGPDLGEPWPVQRLFYSSLPRSFFEQFSQRLAENGLDNSEIAGWLEGDARGFWPDSEVDLVRDVSEFIEQKLAAIGSHRTQLNSENPFTILPEAALRALWSKEYFGLAWSAARRQVTDLFAD